MITTVLNYTIDAFEVIISICHPERDDHRGEAVVNIAFDFLGLTYPDMQNNAPFFTFVSHSISGIFIFFSLKVSYLRKRVYFDI